MSVLLRHPATVPALFSRSVDPDPRSEDARSPWSNLARRLPLAATAAWIAVALIDVPLVKAAAGLALPR
ncbi:hypothetical protein [Lichenibacterium dinghuense]|uniref:hypothetical protein n=1 Tax=Lichenibacterium dinghuense TaxID=2895977 RepID=UPI001F30C89C|nr:hypothetical protein [Lichenibacterium sp. 6Y81]